MRIAYVAAVCAVVLLLAAGPGRADNALQPLVTYTVPPQTPPSPSTLRFATLEWPPYISRELPGNGYVAHLLNEVFGAAGYRVELVFLPWQRAINALSDTSFAGYVPEYFDKTISEKQCLFSEGFPGGPLALVHRTGRSIALAPLEEMRHLRFGVVAGYVNFREFDDADYLFKDDAPDDMHNIRKLLAGRIDVIIGDAMVIQYLYRTHIAPGGNDLTILRPYLEDKPLHLCVNPRHPDAEVVQKVFAKGLETLRRNGRLQQLYDAFVQMCAPQNNGPNPAESQDVQACPPVR
ncbi:substrate-binding periplasmic protein [Desulfovibrio psychrotolerans]|uniref:Solute-binding protein family 3/N-terminal domain-containing protein n=1 Tax=Desulfovibrio psychrotolerans TaxID=415242 RepID=A0A7J0BWT5_9BACT|nr:transporter substrate-binding domain-containing protein [Desulfovibrio psychrotolerans]GFM37635.1 hypothetical protein DSM19430T_23190 [Desulfovibrio psychrotolerans]